MGWFAPCCCPPTQSELVDCAVCFNGKGPPVFCLDISGFADTGLPIPGFGGALQCSKYNGRYLLTPQPGCLGVPTFACPLPCASVGGLVNQSCIWGCGEWCIGIYSCAISGTYQVRVAHVDQGCVFERNYAAAPDCSTFASEVVPYFCGCTPICGVAAPPEARLTALGRAVLSSDCCIVDCAPGQRIRNALLTLEGFDKINANCTCTAAECAALNGTYLLECDPAYNGLSAPLAGVCLGMTRVRWRPNILLLDFLNAANAIVWQLSLGAGFSRDCATLTWVTQTGHPVIPPGNCLGLGPNPPFAFPCGGNIPLGATTGIRVTITGIPRICI